VDGTGTAARFNTPYGVSISHDGTFAIIADQGNHRIRKIMIGTGVVTTLAGSSAGIMDGNGTAVRFNTPQAVSLSFDGTFAMVADKNNNRIRRVTIATGTVTTVSDGMSGAAVTFNNPSGLSVSRDGTYILVVESGNHRLLKVAIATGTITVVAGGSQGFKDATGTAALFDAPTGVSLSADAATALVADSNNHRIRTVAIGRFVNCTANMCQPHHQIGNGSYGGDPSWGTDRTRHAFMDTVFR
jgi:DNA-binding beta-propeller fold protein YncE